MLIDQMHPDPGWNVVCWWSRVGLGDDTSEDGARVATCRQARTTTILGGSRGSALTAALLVLTLIARDWIELVFGVDPDHGDGSLEVALVVMAAIATCVLALLARRDWRRAQPATRRPV